MNDLDSLMLLYGSDKASSGHCYTKLIYEPLFEVMRYEEFTLLELGVQFGLSLKAWSDFFPNAKIIGLDVVDNGVDFSEYPRIEFIKGSQSDIRVLNDFLRRKHFRIILDDASHVSSDIITSFERLFCNVEPGGYYICEDLHGVDAGAAMTYFQMLARSLTGGEPEQCGDSRNTPTQVQSVTFHRSVVIVRRKP